MAPHKMVDGVEVPLTAEEIAEFDARQQAWNDAAPQRAARQQRNQEVIDDQDRKDLLDKLSNATNAQISTWVDNNLDGTDLQTLRAQTRRMFKIVLKALSNAGPL